ncbi:hypothetical protein [Fischerella thermalis]|nr:hypothetical protein [Fischerella thermalis]
MFFILLQQGDRTIKSVNILNILQFTVESTKTNCDLSVTSIDYEKL